MERMLRNMEGEEELQRMQVAQQKEQMLREMEEGLRRMQVAVRKSQQQMERMLREREDEQLRMLEAMRESQQAVSKVPGHIRKCTRLFAVWVVLLSAGAIAYAAQQRSPCVQSLESLSAEAKFFAVLADEAYKSHHCRGQWFIGHVGSHGLTMLLLDHRLSTDRIAVYRGFLLNDPIVMAFSGTNAAADVLTDARLLWTPVQKFSMTKDGCDSCMAAMHVAEEYRGRPIYITGHSLGGARAVAAATSFPNGVAGGHLFNPGAGPASTLACKAGHAMQHLMACGIQHVQVHRIFGDLLSACWPDQLSTPLGNVNIYRSRWPEMFRTYVPGKENSAHSLDNFVENSRMCLQLADAKIIRTESWVGRYPVV